MNNILVLIIHPLFIPIHPLKDEWVKIDPHSSPFPIHLLCPNTCKVMVWKNCLGHIETCRNIFLSILGHFH